MKTKILSLVMAVAMMGTMLPGMLATAENLEDATFTEDFSSYVAGTTTSHYNTSTSVNSATPTVVGTRADGASWITSGVWNSIANQAAYIVPDIPDVPTDAATLYDDKVMWLKGYGNTNNRQSTVNLDLGSNVDIDSIKGLTYSTFIGRGALQYTLGLSGMTMFVSEDEQSYYLFGYQTNHSGYQTRYDILNAGGTKYHGPFVAKVKNGTVESILIDTAHGQWDNGAMYGNPGANQINQNWTITIDNGNISWSFENLHGSNLLKYKWTSTTAADTDITSSFKYPCAFLAMQDGGTMLKTVKLEYSKKVKSESETKLEKNFQEDFSSYVAGTTTSHYNSSTSVNSVTPTVIGTREDGASWTTSGVWNSIGNQAAYIVPDVPDVSTDPTTLYDDKVMWLKGYGSDNDRQSTVNLDLGENVDIDSIKGLSYSTFIGRAALQYCVGLSGMTMFISEDEQSYYLFGYQTAHAGNTYQTRYNILNAGGTRYHGPFVAKVKNGTVENILIDTAHGQWDNGAMYGSPGRNQVNQNWKITVDNGNISWSFENLHGSNNLKYKWTSTTAADADITSSFKYPCAFLVMQDDPTMLKTVSLDYTVAAPKDYSVFKDSFTSYTADNAVTTASNSRNAKLLGTKDNVSWITSGVHYGGYDGVNAYNMPYINAASDYLSVKGFGTTWPGNINLDFGEDVTFKDIKAFKFSVVPKSQRMVGINAFVSGNEKTYYVFGYRADSDSYEYKYLPNNQNAIPFVAKVVNDTITVVKQFNGDSWSTAQGSDDQRTINWDVSVDGNALSWTVTDSAGHTWTDTYTDDSGIISSTWRYPAAFSAIGDSDGAALTSFEMDYDVVPELVYEASNYTKTQLSEMYQTAKATGKVKEVEKLLGLDLSDVITNTATGTVTIDPRTRSAKTGKMYGANLEFADTDKSYFFNSDGTFTTEFLRFAQTAAPIESVRFGGSASNSVNLYKTVTHEPSSYVSLPSDYSLTASGTVGAQATPGYEMGIIEWIKVMQYINPDCGFTLCISPCTTTAADATALISLLTSTDSENTARRTQLGLTAPVNIDYVELGNEIDYNSDVRMNWYTDSAKSLISAVRAANSDVKIIACGPTAPWGGFGWSGILYLNWITKLGNELGDTIDAISFHPYYYGITTESLLDDWLAPMKATIDGIVKTKDIKFVLTEHAINWGTNPAEFTASLSSSLTNSYFLSKARDVDYIDGAYLHTLYGTDSSKLWNMWNYADGSFVDSALDNAFSEGLATRATTPVKNTLTLTNSTADAGWTSINDMNNLLSVSSAIDEFDRLVIQITNMAAYTNATLAFNVGGEYKLVETREFTAPNLYTYGYNQNCADMAKTTVASVNREALTSYTVPGKSITTLILEKESTDSVLDEQFAYANKTLNGMDVGETDTVVFEENTNGTKWTVYGDEVAFTLAGTTEVAGTFAVNDGNLVLTVANASDKILAAGYDVTAFNGDLSNIKQVKFATTDNDKLGGVKLFDSYDFPTTLANLTGDVTWIITVNDTTLSWKATNGSTVKSGEMPYTKADYAYLIKPYLTGVGTLTLDYVTVSYGEAESGLTYENGVSSVSGTFNQAFYNDNAALYIGAYNGEKLMIIEKLGNGAFSFTKPDGYTKIKLMVWDELKSLDDCVVITPTN